MAFGKKKVKELQEFNESDYVDASEENKVIEIEEEDRVEGEEEIRAQPPLPPREQPPLPPREQPLVQKPVVEKEPQKKYALFANPLRVGVVNTKTKEVIAEWEAVQLEIQVEILEKLDKIINLLKE